MDDYQTSHNDQGSPEVLGSGLGASPRKPRTTKPAWATQLEHRPTRRMVAGQLAIRVEQLHDTGDPGTADREAADALAELLDDLIDALRAV